MSFRLLVLLQFAVASALASPAFADSTAKARTLVLESHVGRRPAEMSRFMKVLGDELEARGFAARPETIFRLAGEEDVPRPAILDPGVSARHVAQDVDAAYLQFTNGQYDAAAKLLRSAIDAIHDNPAVFALDTSNTDVLYRAEATLSLCERKRGDAPAAVAAMKELIRTFPTRALPRNKYGPSDEAFYRDVYREVQSVGRGGLTVTGGDSRAVIFIDGQIRGIGSVSIADLIPGIYHVFVQVPQTPGHAYRITLRPSGERNLAVDYELDSVLWATQAWIGFQFATDLERPREARYASKLALRWSAASDKVAVIGTTQFRGNPAIVGTIFDRKGDALLSAAVAFSEATDQRLRDLARFLADGIPVDGLRVMKAPEVEAQDHDLGPRPERRARIAPLILGGLAVLAIVGGTILVHIDQVDDGTRATYHDTGTGGRSLLAAGIVGAGYGLWGLLARSPKALPFTLVGAGASAIAAGIVLVVRDENRSDVGQAPATFSRTRPIGLGLAIAGAASVGVGIVVWMREAPPSIVPIVATTGQGAYLGCAGRF